MQSKRLECLEQNGFLLHNLKKKIKIALNNQIVSLATEGFIKKNKGLVTSATNPFIVLFQ